jgi:hypothetical protein
LSVISLCVVKRRRCHETILDCSAATAEPLPLPSPDVLTVEPPKPLYTPTPEQVVVIAPPTTDQSAIVPRQLAEKAKAHLAKLLDIDVSEIRVVEALAVSWPDTSLGCPQPGFFYAQMIVPGYRLVLEAKGQQYPYHTTLDGQIILCKAQKAGPSTETP